MDRAPRRRDVARAVLGDDGARTAADRMNRLSIASCSLLVTALATAEPIDLLGLDMVPLGGGLPSAWTVIPVRRQRPPTATLLDSAGSRFVRLEGTGRAGWFVKKLNAPVAPSPTRLTVSWRVLVAPARADLRAAATDDAALRVFVVFATQGPFERTPRTLFYTSGTVAPSGYSRPSFQSRALHVIRIGPDAATSMWVEGVLDPFSDYQRIWGGTPRAIVAVGLMQDTEQTGGSATADVRELSWTSRP